MGGGWSKQGSGVPLAERVRPGAPPPPAPAAAVPDALLAGSHPSSTERECPARHCWVSDAVDGEGVRRPGLLVEWRQAGPGWQGRVLYVARLRPGEWQVVEEWLPAALLTPM